MTDVFVSYSSTDRDRVMPLVKSIERTGWSVWWDREIGAGTAFDREIEKAIDDAQCIVVVWSEASVESEWVRTEANEGLERKILVPIAIDEVRLPLAFRRAQTIRLDDSNDGMGQLTDAIARLVPLPAREARDVSPYVGRERELGQMIELVRRAKDGSGSMVLVCGEAGVGKTRLAEETALQAKELGLLVLHGHCLEMDITLPYQPLIEQIEQAVRVVDRERMREALGENAPEVAKLMPELKQHFPDIADPPTLPPEQERRYLLNGVAEFIERAARVQPMMLVFEDLHWADESTCLLLRHLAARLRSAPVVMVGTYRDAELDSRSPFARAVKELLRERLAEEYVLRRLDRGGVAALLAGRAGKEAPTELLDLIYSETEGNPYFVEEVYRHLKEEGKLFDDAGEFRSGIHVSDTEVPRGVRLIIEERIDRVSEDCRKVLTVAAVAGRQFRFDLLAHAGGVDEDTLLDVMEEAEGATLVEDVSSGRDARYRFAHEQIRQTLLNALSFPRRQRFHLRIADALESIYGARAHDNAGEIAHHLYQSGAAADPERTADYLALAGERALASLAFEDGLRRYDQAIEVLDDEEPERRARFHGQRAIALRGAGIIDEAMAAFAAGLDLSRGTELADELMFERARLNVDLYRDAQADLEELLERARERQDRALELKVQHFLAEALYVLSLDTPGYAEKARSASERAIELARELGDRRTLALALIESTHFIDYWAEYREIAIEHLDESERIAEELDDEDLRIENAMPKIRLRIFRPHETRVEAEALREQLEARRDPARLNRHLFWMMWYYYSQCEIEKCIETCDAGIALAERLGVPPVQYSNIKALALMDQARFDEAWASNEQEIDDEDHRFGAAVKQFGVMRYLTELNAVERTLEAARALLPEAIALSRTWMQQAIVDTLVTLYISSAGSSEVAEYRKEVAEKTGFEPSPLQQAELAMYEGDHAGALELASRVAEEARAAETSRMMYEHLDVVQRALVGLERWTEVVASVDEVLASVESAGFRALSWKMRAHRAQALEMQGEEARAREDREAAAATIRDVSATIADSELRTCFESQPLAAQILERVANH